MTQPYVHHEKYRSEHSRSLVLACELSCDLITAAYYDTALSQMVARSVAFTEGITPENAASELSKLVFLSMREYGIPAASLQKIGVCAPIHIAAEVEEQLDPTDMFLRPDTEVVVLPFVSAYADSSFAAFLASVSFSEGTLAAHIGKTLNLAFYTEGALKLASIPLSGSFDGSALESGMRCEFGAIDTVSREENGTVSYCVSGDCDSMGIAPSAALDVVRIMLDTGILDEDGIMTDRDMFYIGEDYYISQKDVRAIQSDKARLAAAFSSFIAKYGEPADVYLTGEVLACNGLKRLAELGSVPEELALKSKFSRNAAESGMIAVLEDNNALGALEQLISSAEDITDSILPEFDDMYISNLSF